MSISIILAIEKSRKPKKFEENKLFQYFFCKQNGDLECLLFLVDIRQMDFKLLD